MLRSISWLQFSIFLLVVLVVYYGYWAWRFQGALLKKWSKRIFSRLTVLGGALLVTRVAMAQDGDAGINQANNMVRDYFDTAINLMYAVGGIIALVGAIKVFQKMANHDHDTGKVAAAWFFACVFLVVVATVIKSFFGLN